MISFSVPLRGRIIECSKAHFNFKVEEGTLLFAGSRHLTVPSQTCSDLISALGSLGFGFMTGCASGVDESFRRALRESKYGKDSLVACAFKERASKMKGLFPLYVVPDGLPPKAALAKRTLWMTSRCNMLILFPSDPIDKGSALAFKSAIMKSIPVFVVSKTRPADSDIYGIYPSSLFGIVDGYWCIPPVYQNTGLCYEAV